MTWKETLLITLGVASCIAVQITIAFVDTIRFAYRVARVEVNTFIKRHIMRVSIILSIVIAAIVLWSGSLWYAYEKGGDAREAAINIETKKQQDSMIKEQRENALIDMNAAAEAERKRASAERAALQNRYALELDIARKDKERAERQMVGGPVGPTTGGSSASCDLDSASYSLLVNTIKATNAASHGASASMPEAVPASVNTGRR